MRRTHLKQQHEKALAVLAAGLLIPLALTTCGDDEEDQQSIGWEIEKHVIEPCLERSAPAFSSVLRGKIDESRFMSMMRTSEWFDAIRDRVKTEAEDMNETERMVLYAEDRQRASRTSSRLTRCSTRPRKTCIPSAA